MALRADDVEPAQFDNLIVLRLPVFIAIAIDAAAQDYVNAAAGHVGGDGHRARLAGVGDDFALSGVLLGVEHLAGNALPLEHIAQFHRVFDGNGADEHRLSFFMELFYFFDHRPILALLRLVNLVGKVPANHGLIGGNRRHFQLIDFIRTPRLR